MPNPTVTAIIPTYNRSQLVVQALESVFGQTRVPDEVIVVDDGSTDDTRSILGERFGQAIRYVWQPNRGPAAARNRGMAEARGDYIAFLDSDDLWVPEKTELQLAFLRQHPLLDCVFGDMSNFTDAPDFSMPEIKNPALHDHLVVHASDLSDLLDCLVVEDVIPTPTVMMSRDAARRTGRFDESLRISEDLDFWLRSTARCRWGFVNAVLVGRRRHGENLISNWTRMNLALLEVLNRAAQTMNGSARTSGLLQEKMRQVHYDLGSAFLKQRRFERAYEHLHHARTKGARSTRLTVKLAAAMIGRRLAFKTG